MSKSDKSCYPGVGAVIASPRGPRDRQAMAFAAVALLCLSTGAGIAQEMKAVPTISAVATKLTLEGAIKQARANEPNYAAAVAVSRVAALDHSLARAALLPTVVYHNQFLYTQPGTNATTTGGTANTTVPRFIANNSVHEYTSQGIASETIGLQQVTAVARTSAASAVALAELEIASRGLVATVVGLYYSSLGADHKLAVAQHAAVEAASFTRLTQEREDVREGAHADVVKARLQQQQRERDLADAILQSAKAHLELAVLVFPDPHTIFEFADSTDLPPLAVRAEVEVAATHQNPELKSALASERASSLDVTAARAAYLPDLGLSFSYGIDAPQFATQGPNGAHNLGYAASMTLDIPVWDWFSTHDRIRQKESLRSSARVALSATQKRVVAQFDEFYAEATSAREQLQSLALSVDTARESLRLTRLRYSAGESTVLEVVDAQNSFTAAEIAKEDGTLRYQMSLANLQTLTGTI